MEILKLQLKSIQTVYSYRESYTKKYQQHVGSSYCCKLAYFDDKFSKPCKSYLDEDVLYNLIDIIFQKTNCCSEVMKTILTKKPVMTKEDDEDFENFTKRWIFHTAYVDDDVKLRDHCHIQRLYTKGL